MTSDMFFHWWNDPPCDVIMVDRDKPMPPVADGNDYEAEDLLCPHCHSYVGKNNFRLEDKPAVCSNCQQKLDWSGYERKNMR